MFGSIASSYDRTNAILSFQLHRLWNRRLVNAAIPAHLTSQPCTFADLCCGTGAISLPWLTSQKTSHQAKLVDFCPEMLACAKQKASHLQLHQKHDVSYIQADVQSIPLEANTIDFATMAYGIRNVESPEKCFAEVYRILKNGGTFGILELTEPNNRLLRLGHRLYLKAALPVLGKLFAKNGDAYRYLSQSIQTFVKPQTLSALLKSAGFSSVQIRPLSGGIATLIIARK